MIWGELILVVKEFKLEKGEFTVMVDPLPVQVTPAIGVVVPDDIGPYAKEQGIFPEKLYSELKINVF